LIVTRRAIALIAIRHALGVETMKVRILRSRSAQDDNALQPIDGITMTGSDEDKAALDRVRQRVHDLLNPKLSDDADESLAEVFARFVAKNRDLGIRPFLPDFDEADHVSYRHREEVPMEGDVYWSAGRTVSSKAIDRRFRKLAL
jgi:hypothetical protein